MKEKTVRAFAPANISCIFKPYLKKNPRWSGSYGIGFTLAEGVFVSVKKAETTSISFNGEKINMQTVLDVILKLTTQKLHIAIDTKLSIGSGFGVSGASALASAYAVNALFGLKKSNKDLAIIAHTVEVKNKTGLGDVVNQFFGGVLFKKKPSSYFSVMQIPLTEKAVYCRVFSPLSTKSVLNNKKLLVAVDKAATEGIKSIKNNASLAQILSISKQFVINSGLLKNNDVKTAIDQIEKKGGHATMIILGNAVVSDIPFPGATKFLLSKKGATLL